MSKNTTGLLSAALAAQGGVDLKSYPWMYQKTWGTCNNIFLTQHPNSPHRQLLLSNHRVPLFVEELKVGKETSQKEWEGKRKKRGEQSATSVGTFSFEWKTTQATKVLLLSSHQLWKFTLFILNYYGCRYTCLLFCSFFLAFLGSKFSCHKSQWNEHKLILYWVNFTAKLAEKYTRFRRILPYVTIFKRFSIIFS